MDDWTAFQRDLLYVIAGLDKPSGLEIKKELDSYYPTEINHGRLYPNLDDLAEKGFIYKGKHDKRTNYYRLTDQGKAMITAREAWEAQYLTDPSLLRSH